MTRLTLAAAFGVAALSAVRAGAQAVDNPKVAPELRADVVVGHQPAVQVGAGLQFPAGYNVRFGIDGAVGVPLAKSLSGPSNRIDGRLDLLGRFLLDPFRQSAYGISVGGGLSLRAEPVDRVRPLLLVAVDVEGRRRENGLVPALQVGLGGGLRIGVMIRHASTRAAR